MSCIIHYFVFRWYLILYSIYMIYMAASVESYHLGIHASTHSYIYIYYFLYIDIINNTIHKMYIYIHMWSIDIHFGSSAGRAELFNPPLPSERRARPTSGQNTLSQIDKCQLSPFVQNSLNADSPINNSVAAFLVLWQLSRTAPFFWPQPKTAHFLFVHTGAS